MPKRFIPISGSVVKTNKFRVIGIPPIN